MKYVHFITIPLFQPQKTNLACPILFSCLLFLQLCARGRSSLFVSSISGPEPVLAARRWFMYGASQLHWLVKLVPHCIRLLGKHGPLS